MKKRIIALFFMSMLALPLLGQAKSHCSISELREQAQAGWEKTY